MWVDKTCKAKLDKSLFIFEFLFAIVMIVLAVLIQKIQVTYKFLFVDFCFVSI